MLQQKKPKDYVIASGKQYSVKYFVNLICHILKIKINWKGKGINEKAYLNGKIIISIDKKYFRPTEVDLLIGDPTKAKEKLGWVPEYDLASLIKDMMQSDVKLMQKDQYLKDGGYTALNYFD